MITVGAGNVCLITKTHFPAVIITHGPLYIADDMVLYSPYHTDTSQLAARTTGYVVELTGILEAITAVSGDLLLAFHPHLADTIIMVESSQVTFDHVCMSNEELLTTPHLLPR